MIRGKSLENRVYQLDIVMQEKVADAETILARQKFEVFLLDTRAGGQEKGALPLATPLSFRF